MNKITSSILSVLVLLVAASCTQNDIDVSDPMVEVVITADASGPVTKTQLNDFTNADGSIGMLWSVGDGIGVITDKSGNILFTSSHTEPVAKADFKGSIPAEESPVVCYYPYKEDAADASALPMTIQSEQKFKDFTSISENDIRVATVDVDSDGSFITHFNLLYSLLQVSLNVEGWDAMDGQVLKSVRIAIAEEDSDISLSGNFTVDATGDTFVLNPVEGETSPYVNISLEEPVDVSAVPVINVIVAPVLKQGTDLKIYLETTESVVSFVVPVLKDIQAGYYYHFPLTMANATEENELHISALPVLSSFTFEVQNNEGKILDTEVYHNGTNTTYRSVSEQEMTVEDGNVTGCIPYLFDFNLAPTFTVSEGCTVWVGDEMQESGVSEQDFSNPVIYTVKSADGYISKDYEVTLSNTGLPVVVLNSSAGSVSFLHTSVPAKTDDWGDAVISIFENGVATDLDNAACGYRLRGNSTQTFPKKPFAIKLDSKTSVLGMAKHKRWCLLANWVDRSMIRNSIAFSVANTLKDHFYNGEVGTEAGRGLIWNPSGQSVELVLNGAHVGNYLLCEQIKIDKNRVAISDCYEDLYDDGAPYGVEDCGYLIECDDNYDENCKFLTNRCYIPVQLKDDVPASHLSYVQNWINDIENNLLNGNYSAAYEKLDINSIIDWWIVEELMMNREYHHPKSVYLYKDGAGKVFAGPVWDFDHQILSNISNINTISPFNNNGSYELKDYSTMIYTLFGGSYTYSLDSNKPYMWYPILFKDETFVERVKTRWNAVYDALYGVMDNIDEFGSENAVSDMYNHAMWPNITSERSNISWFVRYSGDELMDEYQDVVDNLKQCYKARLEGLNTAINQL